MVHRREGTAAGILLLRRNSDDDRKTALSPSRKSHEKSAEVSSTTADEPESGLPQSSDEASTLASIGTKSSPRSTPTRKNRKISQERSVRQTSITPVTPPKRALFKRDSGIHSATDTNESTSPSTTPDASNGVFPKPLRSGLLRASRLQSTSLIEVSSVAARKRGRRKTICNSLEDFSFLGPFGATTPDKWTSVDSLVRRELNPFAIEKLTCSVPLDKLSLRTVKNILASSNGSLAGAETTTTTPLRTHSSSDSDLTRDSNTPFTNNSLVGLSSPQTTAKLLCLYCDKKFTSQKLLSKHTERVHATDGRRLSSRNSIASLSWSSIVAYPGCCYCGNAGGGTVGGGGGQKLANTSAASAGAVTDDLKALFHHFIDIHSDKYYACKPCELRFPTVEGLDEHASKKHSKGTETTKKDKTTTAAKSSAKRTTAVSSVTSLDDLTQPLQDNDRTSPTGQDEAAVVTSTFSEKIYSRKTRRQLKQQAMQTRTTLVTRSCHSMLRDNEDTILTRLAVVQNRLPRGRKGTRNRRVNHSEAAKSEQSPITVPKGRSKVGRVGANSMKDSGDSAPTKGTSNARAEPLSCIFDDDFYETVGNNVRDNLSCHLDGKLDNEPGSRSPLSPTAAVPAIRSTVVRTPLISDSEIHEATALAAVTAFPTLLTAEQYGSDWIAERKIKRPITKNSWKWKWDCVKKYKFVNEGGKIVKKIKQPVLGMRDLSKLDMWTQLAMRTKHETVRRQNVELTGITEILGVGEVAREEKRKQIAQLNSILDSRVFPEIQREQSEQSLVKFEPNKQPTTTNPADSPQTTTEQTPQIPEILELRRRPQTLETPVLSGEWARPRCYICFSCGGRFDKLKTLEEHKVSRHPYILSTHYELVGRELTAGDLYQHLHIPVKALHRHLEHKQSTKYIKSEGDLSNGTNGANGEESMDSINSLSASTTSANGNTTAVSMSTISSLEEHLLAAEAATKHVARRCSKCKKMCNGKLELYRHMLNCAGDYAWRIAQKRKYRYFGVKSRRHARHNFQRIQRRKVVTTAKKEEAADTDGAGPSEKSPKGNVVRSKPSDAETIRRMLENLPAKRACRQIIPNVTKPRSKKFAKNLGLKKLVNATCVKKVVKGKAMTVASTTLTAISTNMRRKQRIMARQITRNSGRMAMRLREQKQKVGSNTNTVETTSAGTSNEILTKKSAPNTPQKSTAKQQQQQSLPAVVQKSPQNCDKISAGEKKPGKRPKKVESVVELTDVVDAPEAPNPVEKTPKKRSPAKRGQDKSPKHNDESPKQPEQVKTPKQSPQRDVTPTKSANPNEPSTSKAISLTEPLNLVVPPANQGRSKLLEVSPVNKRQRGKKLTDCIAKLQEKLGKPFFDGSDNLDKVLSTRQQTPPQDSSAPADPPSVLTSPESLSTSRTPKRKTVTRKIIQKSKSDAFVTPKPSLIPPAIKVECEDDNVATKSTTTTKDGNMSMTSDMYDSLVESDKCDDPTPPKAIAITTTAPPPKDNTPTEFNDSAVSSMSADSVLLQNSTPVKSSTRGSLHDFFPVHSVEQTVRKSTRNMPPAIVVENPPVAPPPVISFFRPFDDKPTTETTTTARKGRGSSGKSPPDVGMMQFEAPPILEEALNLTVAKKRSSPPTTKPSLPPVIPELMTPICFPTVSYVESPINLVSSVGTSDSAVHVDSSKVIIEPKAKSKSKKPQPDSVTVEPLSVPLILKEIEPSPATAQSEPVKTPATKKGRGGAKSSKKNQPQLPEPVASQIPVDQPYKPIVEENKKLADVPDLVDKTPDPEPTPKVVKQPRGRRPRKQETNIAEDIESLIPKIVVASSGEIIGLEEPKKIADSKLSEEATTSKDEKIQKVPKAVVSEEQSNVVQTPPAMKKPAKRGRAKKIAVESQEDKPVSSEKTIPKETEPILEPPKPECILDTPAIKESDEKKSAQEAEVNSHLPPVESSPTPAGNKAKGKTRGSPKKAPPKSRQKKKIDSPATEPIDPKPTESAAVKPTEESLAKQPILEFMDNNAALPTMENVKPALEEKKAEEPVQDSKPAADTATEPIPSTSKKAEDKSIFDTLRAVQENIFFRSPEDSSPARKYTRKGYVPSVKKTIPTVLAPADVPSTSSSATKDDAIAKITLSDTNLLATSWPNPMELRDEPKPSTSRSAYQSPIKAAPAPPKPATKRRSNRNKNNVPAAPNNSSICKELDEIVASFLDPEDDIEPVTINVPEESSGPTRFTSQESLVSPVAKAPPPSVPTSVATSNDTTDSPPGKPPELVADHSKICKQVSVTLTKMSADEIKAKRKMSADKSTENLTESSENLAAVVVECDPVIPEVPKRLRSRRLSMKPENISLSDALNVPSVDELKPDDKQTPPKKNGRKKNSVAPTNAEELVQNIDKSANLPDPKTPAKPEETPKDKSKKATKTPCDSTASSTEKAPAVSEIQKQAPPTDETSPKQTPPVRRRRKNELAAIVADQLLESFKEVDKSRIDELKKLENLAYEKSDDLYITGIRLTPLTKRKIVMADQKEESNSAKEKPKPKPKRKKNANDSVKESERTAVEPSTVTNHVVDKPDKEKSDKSKSSQENLFRNLTEAQETPKLNVDPISIPKLGTRNFNLTFGTFRSYTSTEFAFGSHKDVATAKSHFIPCSADNSCSVDSHGGNRIQDDSSKAVNETSNSKSSSQRKIKKKMSRLKKERKAENENINELRSGLESFTFGKNTFQQFGKGLFANRGFTGLFSAGNKEKIVPSFSASISLPSIPAAVSAEPTKPTNVTEKNTDESKKPILRPSLLSSVLTTETPTKKKPSRDPRLNKSKSTSSGKADDDDSPTKNKSKPTSDADESFVKPKLRATRRSTRSTPTPKFVPDIPDDDDDDNCLAAIAQSVNNRICDDEEFTQADEFDANLPADALSSQTLPATLNHVPTPSLDDQRTMDVNEDENTNTELIDMDLEDDMSMYTSFSQDVSSRSRFGQKRRRRRSILMARRPKKIPDPSLPDVSYDCAICNKTFAKATALAKHQQTFTHVQKLSEYEYLNKVNEPKQKEREKTPSPVVRSETPIAAVSEKSDNELEPEPPTEEIEETPPVESEPELPDDEPPQAEEPPSSQPIQKSPENLPTKAVIPAEIEPISSPEPAETTFDRFQNTTSRIALSQEERLFYECCNMLKGSETPMVERTYPIPPAYTTYDVPNKPVTPKSSERFAYMGSEVSGHFQHGTAYTVKSPMSQSRTSPRYAYPKIDVNQFSDISSDSNPAFTRAQHPHLAMQPGTECSPGDDVTPSKLPFYDRSSTRPVYAEGPMRHHDDGGAYYGGHGEAPSHVSDAGRRMTARTYIGDQRTGKPGAVVTAGYSMVETDRSGMPMGNEQALTSPLHSNSSEGSNNTNITACRMRTKAAMKGYDNFKVSIPTMGLDIQQALERSPHGGCKLTALAEIALGSEAPITPPRYHQPPATPSTPGTPVQDECYEKPESSSPQHQQQKSKPDINEKFAKKYQELIMNNIKPAATKTAAKKKEVCDNIGNKLGYKSKRGVGGGNSKTTAATTKSSTANGFEMTTGGRQADTIRSAIVIEKPPKDIYEFDESQEAMDKDTGRGSPSKGRSTIVIPDRPFKNIGSEEQNTIKFHKPEEVVVPNEEESQMSTTSYSDRDDFNYGSMSGGDGGDTDKEEEENDDDQNSSDSDSCASAQTAKTHKCLIMGRIFGNANKHRPVENVEKPPPPVPEPKKKIPSQELNEMFDRLRKDGGKAGEQKQEIASAKTQPSEGVDKKDTAKSSSAKSNKGGKTISNDKAKKQPAAATKTGKSAPASSQPATKTRDNQRSSRSAAAESEFPREISKLQAELGMTAEEIAELIGEGKRKSQRKCAINRPRTVVDTWSSDEYEDFLSTKDVIAFIEEKEKRSKKKKPTASSQSDPKESSKENENSRSANQVNEKQTKEKGEKVSTTSQAKKPQRVADRLMQRFNKSKAANSKKKDQSSVASKSETAEKSSADAPPIEDPPKEPTSENSTSQKKQPTLSVKPRIKSRHHTDNESESDFENELRRRKSTSTGKRTTLAKITKRRKTIAFKEEHNEHTSDSRPIQKPKQSANLKTSIDPPTAAATTTTTTTTNQSNANKTNLSSKQTSPSTVRPLARRKRIASEMLYYWSSSSSDEEFGRIETNEDDLTQKDEYLPKHGWIVGDSHKKLVTLLATAKGKKSTDIKEPGGKRK